MRGADLGTTLLRDEAARDRARRNWVSETGSQHTLSSRPADQGQRFLVQPADRFIGHDLFVNGAFEPHNIKGALELLASHGQTPTMLVDIGANIGPTTIAMLGLLPGARAIAMEPDPTNYRLLEQNILANGVANRVSLIHAAAADAETKLVLELSPDNFGDHRIRTRTAVADRKSIEVRGAPLDGSTRSPRGLGPLSGSMCRDLTARLGVPGSAAQIRVPGRRR